MADKGGSCSFKSPTHATPPLRATSDPLNYGMSDEERDRLKSEREAKLLVVSVVVQFSVIVTIFSVATILIVASQ